MLTGKLQDNVFIFDGSDVLEKVHIMVDWYIKDLENIYKVQPTLTTVLILRKKLITIVIRDILSEVNDNEIDTIYEDINYLQGVFYKGLKHDIDDLKKKISYLFDSSVKIDSRLDACIDVLIIGNNIHLYIHRFIG